MHATSEYNNTKTTEKITTPFAALPANLNSSQEQVSIRNTEHKNNSNINKCDHSHHNLINNTDQNGHTTSISSDDLYMSASSSINDFCGKAGSATKEGATTTHHVLSETTKFLVITPSTCNDTKSIEDSKTQLNEQSLTDCQTTKSETVLTAPKTSTKSFETEISVKSSNLKTITPVLPVSLPIKSNTSCTSPMIISNTNNTNNVNKSSIITALSDSTSLTSKPTNNHCDHTSDSIIKNKSNSTSLFERIEFGELLQWKDMPRHLQFNPYVLTGYRPLSTVKGCFFSLFYWHNETINILTHGIPIVYILATVPSLMPWEREFRFLSFCHIFGAVAPWCGSFIYHLFMNLERGENIYYRLLKIDMVGIWISQSFGALPMVTASVYCFSFKIKWFMIISYCLLSLWGLYKALNASSPWQRRLCFALPFTMRVVLTFFRTLRWVGGNPLALTHVYLQDLVSVFGGAIGAMHIPEKWFPGSVDLYLNSHNIMHVLVVVAVYSMHKATVSDIEWMSKIECDNFFNSSVTIENQINEHLEL